MPLDLIKSRNELLLLPYKDFIYSEFSEITTLFFAEKLKLSEEKRVVFENGLMLYLLLFFNKFDLIEFIIRECSVSVSEGISVTDTISNGLPTEIVKAMNEARQILESENSEPIKNKDRFALLSSLPENKLLIYYYLKTGSKISQLVGEYIQDQDIRFDTYNLVGDIILGFYKVEDTVPLLQQELGLNAKTAALLGADVLDFLAPLSDPTFVVPTEEPEEVEQVEEIVTNEMESVVSHLHTTPATSQPVVTPVVSYRPPTTTPSVHTMATDATAARAGYQSAIEIEPTYRSEQPDMRKTLSDLPSYANPSNTMPQSSTPKPPIDPPRWGV